MRESTYVWTPSLFPSPKLPICRFFSRETRVSKTGKGLGQIKRPSLHKYRCCIWQPFRSSECLTSWQNTQYRENSITPPPNSLTSQQWTIVLFAWCASNPNVDVCCQFWFSEVWKPKLKILQGFFISCLQQNWNIVILIFLDCQFPIDITSVEKDHDFLDRDSMQPLVR